MQGPHIQSDTQGHCKSLTFAAALKAGGS